MRRFVLLLLSLTLALLLLTACSGGKDDAAQTVAAYLQALIARQSDQLSTLSCADWEASALTEMDAFQNVEAQLVGPDCATTGQDGDTTLVMCSGKITASYNGELQEFPLGDRVFKVATEGGELRVCGYR
ncbi:hypothetical protein LARV_03884 [Longilinea arvoryzae]|uniref:Lipoprotein n=1 Tax=Longilinea arvoryzae TaxID=360412 RepID=A0A0K8MXV7_9CHLR|nr:hypothetical protein [Longilinea arvoryzae]GAP16088.1 hypothetical protein LARV_03884 [Longilinea arvoryzae]